MSHIGKGLNSEGGREGLGHESRRGRLGPEWVRVECGMVMVKVKE